MVDIQVQLPTGMWQSIIRVEQTNPIGIRYRLDEAQRTYKSRCRAVDTKTGCMVDFRG